jgi:hypothetical protein
LLDGNRRVDRSDMGKRLRKIAQRSAGFRIDFLGEQA